MTIAAGTFLGPYEILNPLGSGGMGEVYRARDSRLAREVAVKVIPASLSDDAAALARFEREAKSIAALSHPNILAVHDVGRSGGVSYAVMELLEGQSLRERLADGALPQRKAIEIAREIALGLAAAHDKGIVHRDLKPENIFLTKSGLVKILDFGLARQLPVPTSQDTQSPTVPQATEPGTILGTVGYMAPEQLRGHPADARSDIFCFGATLYEMLSGNRAFLGDTAIETMNAILKENPAEISLTGRPIPPALERIVTHCLEKRPEERFQSARDLAFDLASLSTATTAHQDAGATTRVSGRKRRLAGAAAAAAALALAVWAGARLGSPDMPPLTFRRLTFRRGNLLSARFAPDGQTVIYGAAWEGKPSELFSVRTDSVESRSLGLGGTDVLSISPKGELAIKVRKASFQEPGALGMLARLPLGGGAPRELEDGVLDAAWTPDGEDMAVVRLTPEGRSRIEWPVGHMLYESFFLAGGISMSPAGDLLAFVERENGGQSAIWTADRAGKRRALSKGWTALGRPVWSKRTDELLFLGARLKGDLALRALARSGRDRVLWRAAPGFTLHDVAADGRLLLERSTNRHGVIWKASAQAQEKELGWLDGSSLRGVTGDGSTILFSELGDAVSQRGGVYIRPTDGSQAIHLGDGDAMNFSPDGKWVSTITRSSPPQVVLLPTGPGSPRKIPTEGLAPVLALLVGNGNMVIVSSAPGQNPIPYVVDAKGGRPKEISLSEVNWDAQGAFSRDGSLTAYSTTDRRLMIWTNGAAKPIPGASLAPGEFVTVFSADNRFVLTQTQTEIPARIFRTDVQTGVKTLWKEIQPADLSGLIAIDQVHFTRDDGGYAYSYERVEVSDLYVVEGLK